MEGSEEYLFDNENEAWEKNLRRDSTERKAGYLDFKALCWVLGHFPWRVQNNEHL